MSCEMCGPDDDYLEERIALDKLEAAWKALEEWLSQARGRDYVTRTPAVVLQKMRDLMGETE